MARSAAEADGARDGGGGEGGHTAWVLAEQLSLANPVLKGAARVLMIESRRRIGAPAHRQKLHLLLSAMRHFGAELEGKGFAVELRSAESFSLGVAEHRSDHPSAEVRVLEPTSLQSVERVRRLQGVSVVRGGLFLTSPEEFGRWARGRRRLRMEDFYRMQRRRLGILMDGGEPVGGRWNFDRENRRRVPDGVTPPRPYRPREDEIDGRVRSDLDRMAKQALGSDGPRLYPATRAQALRALAHFVEHGLPHFGVWQDAMLSGQRWLWHSRLSPALNLGLLDPLECAQAAERAYREGSAPIQSVEGFVRQLIGWREYVWGIYRLDRARPARRGRHLPAVFEGGPTRMACIADTLGGLRATGYAHHIERLMLLGNLMLGLDVSPAEATGWFTRWFIDGYDWVMAPNVAGMALWADGGRMMSKPYVATGKYVQRMSDHCAGCPYDPARRHGPGSCPFTTLYWDYLQRNHEPLSREPRMRPALRNLARLSAQESEAIAAEARALRKDFQA